MNKLNKMLFREIVRSKGQFIATAFIIFVGILVFAATYMAYLNLKNSVDYYYQEYNLLDYYAKAQNIPARAVTSIQNLKGVRAAQGRISLDVPADMGETRRVTVRLISLPDEGMPEINKLLITSGGYIDKNKTDSCLVSSKFAEGNNLGPGDRIKVIIDLKEYEFEIDGAASSPEFIFALKGASSFSPQMNDFGILYVRESTLRNLSGLENSYNEVHVVFQKTVDQTAVIDKIENTLKPYGFLSGTERKDQLSVIVISNEFKQLEGMADSFPVLFLSVAAMIIYIMQRRVVKSQRGQIGVLKAFGYTSRSILWHYVKYSLLVALAGSIPAILAGIYLGTGMTAMYNQFFSIPVMKIKVYWDIIFTGIGLSLGFCLIAGYYSAKYVLQVQPAESMRPEVPAAGRRILLERIGAIWSRITFGWKMSIRNIFRSPSRTLLTMLGVVFTIMFFMTTLFMMDSVDYIFNKNFLRFGQYDYKVVFSKPASYDDAVSLGHIDGIQRVEPVLEVPAEFRKDWKKESSKIIGVRKGTDFYNLVDENENPIEVPAEGILLAHVYKDKLGVKRGDRVTITTYLDEKKETQVEVAGFVKQYMGFDCFMDIDGVNNVLSAEGISTGILTRIDQTKSDIIKKELFRIPLVEDVSSRLDMFESYMEYMDLTYVFIGIMVAVGIAMGFAIMFNTTVINITERKRELASLRVLGYTHKEISRTILRENMLLAVLALIPGVIVGRIVCELLVRQMGNELFTMEVVIYPTTYIITILSVFIFTLLAQWANKKNIFGLDMVEVLKNREG